jgi:NADPH:quinone reductase
MKALVVSQPGGDFEVHSVPTPEPEPGHVLVRIQASCINPLDTKIRAGAAAHAKQPLPAILGLDMAGVVERVGKGVLDYSVGDEVFGMVGGVGGHQGTLAEYISVPAVLLAHKPGMLSMQQAAALPLVTITAWEGLIDRAKVRAGQTVLVHAGAGGVGHIVVQLARAQGAEVFATVSPEKQDAVVRLGATPIDYRSNSVEQYVQKYTNGAGFDIVYDRWFHARCVLPCGQDLHRACCQLSRLGEPLPCAIILSRRQLFGSVHITSASDWQRARTARPDSKKRGRISRCRKANPHARK